MKNLSVFPSYTKGVHYLAVAAQFTIVIARPPAADQLSSIASDVVGNSIQRL